MHDGTPRECSRRDVLALAGFPLWSWIFGPRHATLAGVRFRYLRRGDDRRHYIWIHGNERTAGEVLRSHMRTHDGRAFLIENTVRNVRVSGGEVDPNRLWSREGAEKNIVKLNPAWDFFRIQQTLDELDRGRQRFLDRLLPERGELIVALHNNSEGYSVNDEIPISDRTSIPLPGRPREFMLATDPRDYELLSRTGFNVVLQKDAPKEDDGSLSRLAAARRVRYVNIECPHGAAAEQRELLAQVEQLPERHRP